MNPTRLFNPSSPFFSRLLLFSLLGLAHWFFGNLYEAIVLAPNLLVSSFEHLQAWQHYFSVTNQVYYYVPVTQLAVLVTWVTFFKSQDERLRKALGRASLLGLLSLLLTGYIVTQLNLRLFFGDLRAVEGQLYQLALEWNIGNLLRVGLVGASLFYVAKAYQLTIQLNTRIAS